jgi:ketosteroid isomerase-like protein
MLAQYASDVVFFDAVPPYQHLGADAYRQSWKTMFPHLPPRIESEVRDVGITVNGDVAFMHCLNRIVNADTRQNATCGWVRVTVCYQRQRGAWKVVHEHVSVPFDPQTSQAAFIREP